MWLAIRSLAWTLLLPGIVAGYVPWRFFGFTPRTLDWTSVRAGAGAVLIASGVVLLALCVLEFARTGRGTLSPADPPRHLVARGLYRHVRNPMYLSVTAILLGEAAATGLKALVFYWAIWFVCVNLFVIGYEEPWLRRQFGASYDEYAHQVGRWIPKR